MPVLVLVHFCISMQWVGPRAQSWSMCESSHLYPKSLGLELWLYKGIGYLYHRVHNIPWWVKGGYQFSFFKSMFIGVFTMLCQFLLYSKVSQLYIYPLFFKVLFPQQSLESRVPCAIEQLVISYPFYKCVYGPTFTSTYDHWKNHNDVGV